MSTPGCCLLKLISRKTAQRDMVLPTRITCVDQNMNEHVPSNAPSMQRQAHQACPSTSPRHHRAHHLQCPGQQSQRSIFEPCTRPAKHLAVPLSCSRGRTSHKSQVLGLCRVIYVATRNPARLFCNVLVERHKHFSESILAARCINDPYLPDRTQSHLQHSVRNRISVRSWDELGRTSGLSNVDVQNFNRRRNSCCTVGDNSLGISLNTRPTI
jgi:hypothetical protein